MTLSILTTILLLVNVVPESARFSILQDGRRIGSEEFTISARPGGYLAVGRTQIDGDPTPITSRMELDENLNPTSYEYRRGTGVIRVQLRDPISEYQIVVDGQSETLDFRFPADGFIADNNFFHHLLLLLYKAAPLGKTMPVFVPQDMRMGQVTVKPLGDRTFELEMGDVRAEAVTDANGKLVRVTVPDARIVVER